jgi:hypothetical protein
MKISLLRERENFDEIFLKSLSNYLKNKYQWNGELGFSFIPNATRFIVNDLLNVFYSESISRDKLGPLTQEFSWHPNPVKGALQKLYIFLAVRFPLEKILSSANFYLTDKEKVLEGVVIIPGNHSIRLVDTIKETCTVICKDGFDKSLLIQDAKIRQEYSNLNVPHILELNSREGWYEEERVVGLPLNRLNDESFKQSILTKCKNDLRCLYTSSSTKLQSNHYVDNLLTQVYESLLNLNLPNDNGIKNKIDIIVDYVSFEFDKYKDSELNICSTHGDFQPANILCAVDGFWVIDWEYSKIRSIFYDALVFDLESRFTRQLSVRLKTLFDSINNGAELFSWTGMPLNQNNIHYLYVFILEDILLKLQELSSEAIEDKQGKLKPYLTEIQLFLSSLNK